jgi:hypothetical protein
LPFGLRKPFHNPLRKSLPFREKNRSVVDMLWACVFFVVCFQVAAAGTPVLFQFPFLEPSPMQETHMG